MLKSNSVSAPGESFDRIVVITDRDEVITERKFSEQVEEQISIYNGKYTGNIVNNEWLEFCLLMDMEMNRKQKYFFGYPI